MAERAALAQLVPAVDVSSSLDAHLDADPSAVLYPDLEPLSLTPSPVAHAHSKDSSAVVDDGLSPAQRVRAARMAAREDERRERELALAQARREAMEERRALAARVFKSAAANA